MSRIRSARRWGALAILALSLARPGGANAKEPWQPVTPEELAGTKSTFEPEAAAEALLWKIDIDDQDWPANRRAEQYVRYKIYDPEKAEKVLRLSQQVLSYDGTHLRDVELKARLHLPDGTVRNFGAESVHERDMVKQGSGDSFWRRFFGSEGLTTKEKFLAVGGAVPGAILEFVVVVNQRLNYQWTFQPLQIDSVPVRLVIYRQRLPVNNTFWFHTLIGLNSAGLERSDDPASHTVTLQAHNLASLPDEPMSGPLADRAVTVADCYLQQHYVRSKGTGKETTRKFTADEPWAAVATLERWISDDHVDTTEKVKRTAADLTQGAVSDLEKARRIHDFVQRLHQQFLHAPPATKVGTASVLVPMDEVLDFAAVRPPRLASMDFLWLAISLYRAAGLQAEDLMLPNRDMAMLSRKIVAPAFLPARCAAVKIGDAWHFSMPQLKFPMAFDELPWEQEGLGGLLALDQQQEFIDVPFSLAQQSQVHRKGDFHLDADGTLTGEGTVVYGGHESQILRTRLNGQPRDAQLATIQSMLVGNFDGAEIEVTDLRHVEDVYEPLEVTFKANWPGYGVLTDGRMLFRPFVFSTNTLSPFSAPERRNKIVFPYRWQQWDEVTIALPDGFAPEAKDAPPSYPGPVLSYEVGLALDHKHMVLHVSRKFSTGLISALAKDYPAIKGWYDAVALSDQHTLVLVQDAKEISPAKSPAVP